MFRTPIEELQDAHIKKLYEIIDGYKDLCEKQNKEISKSVVIAEEIKQMIQDSLYKTPTKQ